MTYQLMAKRFMVNETHIETAEGSAATIGQTMRRFRGTPKKANWSGKVNKWAQDDILKSSQTHPGSPGSAAAQRLMGGDKDNPFVGPPRHVDEDGTDDDYEEESDEAEEAEEAEEAKQADEAEEGEELLALDFKSAIKKVYLQLKEESGWDVEPSGATQEYTLVVKHDDDDKRPYIEETITGTNILSIFFRNKNIKTGQGVIDFVKANGTAPLPVSSTRQTKFGKGWFSVDHLKGGKGPVFSHVSFDEGHILRNYRSSFHMAAALLPRSSQVLYTGTPIYNDPADLRSYMFLFAGLSDIDSHLSVQCTQVEPLCANFLSSQQLLDEVVVATTEYHDPQYVKDLFEWADKDISRRAWWCLLRGFRAFAASSDADTKVMACRVFSSSFISQRKLATPLEDHMGKTVYPTSGLPPCLVRTAVVRHCPSFENKLAAVTDLMHKQLQKAPTKDKPKAKARRPWERRGREAGLNILGKRVQSEIRHVLNLSDENTPEKASALAYKRVLCTLYYNFRFFAMYFDPEINRRDPLQNFSRKAVDDIKKLLSPDRDPKKGLPQELAADRSSDARLGAGQVSRMATFDPYGGMTYVYLLLAGRAQLPSDNIPHMLAWAVGESPMLFEVIAMVVRGLQDPGKYGNRVFIVVESPLAAK